MRDHCIVAVVSKASSQDLVVQHRALHLLALLALNGTPVCSTGRGRAAMHIAQA
jgi:hypothetical protein